MLVAPPLSQFALQFGPPEYFGLMMKSELKKQFDQGLKGIKFYAEKS